MVSDPVGYLDLDDVPALTERLLGTPTPIRDVGLLGSAVARPPDDDLVNWLITATVQGVRPASHDPNHRARLKSLPILSLSREAVRVADTPL